MMLCLSGVVRAYAVHTTVTIYAVAASVQLTSMGITHTAPLSIAQDNNVIAITGLATADTSIKSVALSWYNDAEYAQNFSTIDVAGLAPGSKAYDFSFNMPTGMDIGAQFVYYRITLEDAGGSKMSWPMGGEVYQKIDMRIPGIEHRKLQRVSDLYRIVVATGTVTAAQGLATLTMSYKTNNEAAYTDQVLTYSNNETAAGFRFEMTVTDRKAATFEYYFTAQDKKNNKAYSPVFMEYFTAAISSAYKFSMDPKGGLLTFPDGNADDGETSIYIPEGALTSSKDITITEIDPLEATLPPGNHPALTDKPVSVYRFEPSGLVFNKLISMKLLYKDFDNNGMIDGTNTSEKSMRVMWWDGYEWRPFNTKVDPVKNTAETRTKHFSYYAVFPANPLTDDDYRAKEKIITPASVDTRNDYATFGMLGPDDIVNIYDVNGNRIRQINGDEISWDGKDDDGDIVPSGIYVYQMRISGKIISGTIVVAK